MLNPNIEQTKQQFEYLYGDQDHWSRTVAAAYEVMFCGEKQVVAANKYGITRQSIFKFLQTNIRKHQKSIEYAKAG